LKHYLIILFTLILSVSVFGQSCSIPIVAFGIREHYITPLIDCYIDSEEINKGGPNPFTPTHAEVDSAEMGLRRNDSLKILLDWRYVRNYRGFINEKEHKTLGLYFYNKPGENGIATTGGPQGVYFDLVAKIFYY
jgi:hypothetical protein